MYFQAIIYVDGMVNISTEDVNVTLTECKTRAVQLVVPPLLFHHHLTLITKSEGWGLKMSILYTVKHHKGILWEKKRIFSH